MFGSGGGCILGSALLVLLSLFSISVGGFGCITSICLAFPVCYVIFVLLFPTVTFVAVLTRIFRQLIVLASGIEISVVLSGWTRWLSSF